MALVWVVILSIVATYFGCYFLVSVWAEMGSNIYELRHGVKLLPNIAEYSDSLDFFQ